MKRYFLLAAILLSALNIIAQERGMKSIEIKIDNTSVTLYDQSHALLIGVSDYSEGLKPLPGVADDINAVKAVLEKSGFDVHIVMNPDNITLNNAYNEFIARYGQNTDSRLVFYFAGHGYTKKIRGNDIGYILPVNCPNPDNDLVGFQGRAMPLAQIDIIAKQIESKHALFIFDACFSGSVFYQSRDIPDNIDYNTTQPVRQFITSGSANETVPDKSIFCGQFVAGLDGEADRNKDGFITGSEFGEYLRETVINYSDNSLHPQYGKIRDPNLDKGDFVFLCPKKIAPPVVPVVVPTIEEERDLVRLGKVEVATGIEGSLFLDGKFIKQVEANKVFVLKDISKGEHLIKIAGADTIERSVDVLANQTVAVTIEKTTVDVNSFASEMVLVKGGIICRSLLTYDSYVIVSDFFIGKYEVTQKQWRDVMGNAPSFNYNCDQCPVEGVSWFDVHDFIKKLNKKTGKQYRLPTEAEWEFAARGGIQSQGFDYCGNRDVKVVSWYRSNSVSQPHPVGQKQPNELGIFDMGGNVQEWCGDWFGKYKNSTTINSIGPLKGTKRVIRGGGWDEDAEECTSSNRNADNPYTRRNNLGFRLVLVP